MGGIVIVVKGDKPLRIGGHALDVSKFMSMKGLKVVEIGDDYNGTITFDVDRKTIVMDTEYFKLSKKGLAFWKALGFRVLREVEE